MFAITISVASVSVVASIALSSVGLGAEAVAPTPPQNSIGTLSLADADGTEVNSGSTSAMPSFASGTAPQTCPADFNDAARLGLISETGEHLIISALAPITDAAAPASVTTAVVLDDYISGTSAHVTLECIRLYNGIPVAAPTVFSVGLELSNGRFSLGPDPSIPTPTPTPTPTEPSSPEPSPTAGPGGGPTNPQPDEIATTGADPAGILSLAGGLVALGAAGALYARKRNTARASNIR